MDETIIYHNPNCGTSRKILAMLRASGLEPRVIEYLKTPPDRTALAALLVRLGMTPRQVLRRRGTPFDELDLGNERKTDEELLSAIVAHPILLERPIVVSPKGARLCRPAETVQSLLGQSSEALATS